MFYYLGYVAIGLISVIVGFAKLVNSPSRQNALSLSFPIALISWPFILVLAMVGFAEFVEIFGRDVDSSSLPGKYVYKYCDQCTSFETRFAFEIDSNLNYKLIDTANLKSWLPRSGKFIFSNSNNTNISIVVNGSAYHGYIERHLYSFDVSFYCDRDPDEGYCMSMTKFMQ